jgi:hypothetical protein
MPVVLTKAGPPPGSRGLSGLDSDIHGRPVFRRQIGMLLVAPRPRHVQPDIQPRHAMGANRFIPRPAGGAETVDRAAAKHLWRLTAPAHVDEVARGCGEFAGFGDQSKAIGRARGALKVEMVLHKGMIPPARSRGERAAVATMESFAAAARVNGWSSPVTSQTDRVSPRGDARPFSRNDPEAL